MKILNLSLIYATTLIINNTIIIAQKNSGIFYSTLYAKEYPIKRIDNFGKNARHVFLKDVNGDGHEDAVAILNDGCVEVSLSDGKMFTPPKNYFHFNYQLGFVQPIMGDINGDGKVDLVYMDKKNGFIYCCLSGEKQFDTPLIYQIPIFQGTIQHAFISDFEGDGKCDLIWSTTNTNKSYSWYLALASDQFNTILQIKSDFGNKEDQIQIGDLDGDGKSDIIAYNSLSGICKAALSNGLVFGEAENWLYNNTNCSSSNLFLLDINNDQKDDLVLLERENKDSEGEASKADWIIYWSDGEKFVNRQYWIKNFLYKEHKTNIPDPEFFMVGEISKKQPAAVVVSQGLWLAIEYKDNKSILDPALIDTYEAWGCDYIPEGGTYDSGDSITNAKQIKMIHDAGFTYITMDITNGSHAWVDERATKFMQRVREWNRQLKPGDHKMYVNIALGLTREVKGENAFFTKFNKECERAWYEFYLPFKDLFYTLNGKPMVIHMISNGWDYIHNINLWKGDKTFINKFTNRWMDGNQTGADKNKPNTYGWIVPGENTVDREMMPLMPGFWNGITWYDRKNGEMYKRQWLRIFQYNPASIWLNSFNETWEHTSVEPSFHIIDQFVSNPLFTNIWVDNYGNRYDSYYWDITFQYNKLFMENVLIEGNYIEEDSTGNIYKITKDGFVSQKQLPVMAPVLLLPVDFIKNFNGRILNQE